LVSVIATNRHILVIGRVLQEGVGSGVVLLVVVLRVPVLVPVADQRLRVERVLVHFCFVDKRGQSLKINYLL